MDNLGKELARLMWQVSIFTETVATLGMENTQTKEDFSPVTLADLGAQIMVSHWLNTHFEGEPLIAEETVKSLPEENRDVFIDKLKNVLEPFLEKLSQKKIIDYLELNCFSTEKESYWVLDPLDGTKGFLRGNQYAISLGHINKGTIDIGVLACPRLRLPHLSEEDDRQGCLFFAEKGEGAWVQLYDFFSVPIPIHVSQCKNPEKAILFRSYESKHTDVEKTNRFCEKMGMKLSIPVDSQVKYGLLACGEGEIILRFTPPDNPNYREKVWDHVGGAIILHEAGGKVTDVFGKTFQYNGEPLLNNSVGVFASNGYLHDIGVKILQEIMGEI